MNFHMNFLMKFHMKFHMKCHCEYGHHHKVATSSVDSQELPLVNKIPLAAADQCQFWFKIVYSCTTY